MSRIPNPELINIIKKIAIDEIIINGINNISMRKIAKKADITATTIYYYFDSKEKLFEKIKIDSFEELNNYVLKNINSTDRVIKQLKNLIEFFIKWILNNINLAELIFDKLPAELNIPEEQLFHYSKINYKVIEILENGKKNNEFFFDDAKIESSVGFAMIFGLIKLHTNKRLLPDYWDNIDILINRVIELIFLSIGVNIKEDR